MAYLLRDELDSARFLWKRLPNEVKADPELQAMWAVGTAMWQQKHAEVGAAADTYLPRLPYCTYAGYAHQPPACCTWTGGAGQPVPGPPRSNAPPYACQPRACRTYRVPWHRR